MPAGFGSSPLLSGGLGIILPALGPAREVLAGLRQDGAGNARGEVHDLRPGWRSMGSCAPPESQEAWPDAEPWATSCPLGESRSGTPTGVRALQGARRTARCGTCKTASVGVLLPFYLLLDAAPIVMTSGGPQPGLSDEGRLRRSFLQWLWQNSGANKNTRRENECPYSPLPACGERSSARSAAGEGASPRF